MTVTQPADPKALDDEFIKALLGEDELGVVIRSHAFVEANLDRLIELALPAPAYFEKLNLNYARKIDLACALGLVEGYQAPLKKLGQIRNSFAHKLDSKLNESVVSQLYAALPNEGKEAVQVAYDRTNSQMKEEGKSKVKELEARDQYVLIAVSLERYLMSRILMKQAPKNEG